MYNHIKYISYYSDVGIKESELSENEKNKLKQWPLITLKVLDNYTVSMKEKKGEIVHGFEDLNIFENLCHYLSSKEFAKLKVSNEDELLGYFMQNKNGIKCIEMLDRLIKMMNISPVGDSAITFMYEGKKIDFQLHEVTTTLPEFVISNMMTNKEAKQTWKKNSQVLGWIFLQILLWNCKQLQYKPHTSHLYVNPQIDFKQGASSVNACIYL